MSKLDLSNVLNQDRFRLNARLRGASGLPDGEKKSNILTSIASDIERSEALRTLRKSSVPKIEYPEALPVSQKSDVIKQAISAHQVVIIAGETGSGKTTQIPKMCLELGRGIEGRIAHTQPRRLAARTVANRLCDELSCELGSVVGYKVRFNDQVSDQTLVKLMTDGILLAELQQDRYLNQYDTIIIDEAHERSLNIDFLLGYLKTLLKKRKDLKVIITSATIDPEKFSKHFDNAPIIEVSGRTYPVEVRYRPLEDVAEQYLEMTGSHQDTDLIAGIFAAVDELGREDQGDILIFLNGEREIRDIADALQKRKLKHTEVLPLYARLSAAEQNRIFAPHNMRRIVLATNVAETSLTVPGIKYVIDSGTARISRYSYRSKVQRLPIEPISQASANQRKGRCGRTQAGICIRLYSEQDFVGRPEFTDPEILRTNLASVILQMLSLRLGDIEQFPFIQRPDSRFVNDGIRLLEELQAIDVNKPQQLTLTQQGRELSRLPVDPRLAKMVLMAGQFDCVYEVIVIVAALTIQEPRERPKEFQNKADEYHKRFQDKESDFVSYLNLWDYLTLKQTSMSSSQFRKLCKTEFLNYLRIREWQDLVYQLSQTAKELNLKVSVPDVAEDSELHDTELQDIATSSRDYRGIHCALLSGLLSHVGMLDKKQEKDTKAPKENRRPVTSYIGARNSTFYIFPGSGLFKSKPSWVIAAELVETTKLYARTVAKIEPEWIEPLAEHLVSIQHFEPYWSEKKGNVFGSEKVSLYGLPIVPKRNVLFEKIDPRLSHELFIKEAIVNQRLGRTVTVLEDNNKLIDDIRRQENKLRRRELLVDEMQLEEFYQQRIPQNVCSRNAFLKWIKDTQGQSIKATEGDFCLLSDRLDQTPSYPDVWKQHNLLLPLEYDFEPGTPHMDGVSVVIPLPLLNQVTEQGFDWFIDGYRHELFTQLIKTLPKTVRRNFVPAPDYATALLQRFNDLKLIGTMPLLESMSEQLFRMTGNRVSVEDWQPEQLPSHLTMNFRIVDDKGQVITQGKALQELKTQLQGQMRDSIVAIAEQGIERDNVTDWDFEDLPEKYVKRQGSIEIQAFPCLTSDGGKLKVELLDNQNIASFKHREGVIELLCQSLPSPIKYLQQKLPNKSKLVMYFNPFGNIDGLITDCIRAVIDDAIGENVPRDKAAFEHLKELVRAELNDRVLDVAKQVEKVLYVGHSIAKQLKGKVTLDQVQARGAIKAHLDSLIYKGFVYQTGIARLADLLRYVTALEKRLDKLKVDPNRDRINQLELDKLYDAYNSLIKKVPSGMPTPESVKDIYWMLEELRVSLFAQAMGTKYPVSAKRVKQALNEVALGA